MDVDDLTDDLESMSFNSTATTTTATGDSTIHRSTSSSSETTWTTSSSSFPRSSTKLQQLISNHPSSTTNNPYWDAILRSRSSTANATLAATTGTTTTTTASPLPPLSFSDIRFICRLGSGDIGSVFLSDLKSADGVYFAAKVMDQKELAARNKQGRAKTEREILETLDHPFLPTLYGAVETPKWSCLLTEFCPGGDLHVLRQRQAFKRFEESAVRFYASEVVVALEYIHMLGIVYRDLKPENVLVRSDGHIMLTDFDLSLRCDVASTPTPQIILSTTTTTTDSNKTNQSHKPPQCASASSCILPNCMVPSVSSCFAPGGFGRRRRKAAKLAKQRSNLPSFVAEPVDVRSMSFVGTHEYLAPEIVSGEGHGSSVDWWTLGVFMYELFYGVTPFRGVDNELTLANIVARALEFPKEPSVPSAAKDLISQLLIKDPDMRLGSLTGASMIKQHPFFSGVNWALLRCMKPPFVPPVFSVRDVVVSSSDNDSSSCDTTPVVDYY